MKTEIRKVLVVGASGGSGRAVVEALLARSVAVTAYARHADRLTAPQGANFSTVSADVMDMPRLRAAVRGQDAVVVTLGISEPALRVRLFGSRGTPLNVRSEGTRRVIEAMQAEGVRRLVVQTSFGVGESRHRLPLLYRILFALLLKPQIVDTERQEQIVRASGLDWLLVQPVNLTDGDDTAHASVNGEVKGMQVSRRAVGRFIAIALGDQAYAGRSVAVSS